MASEGACLPPLLGQLPAQEDLTAHGLTCQALEKPVQREDE